MTTYNYNLPALEYETFCIAESVERGEYDDLEELHDYYETYAPYVPYLKMMRRKGNTDAIYALSHLEIISEVIKLEELKERIQSLPMGDGDNLSALIMSF